MPFRCPLCSCPEYQRVVVPKERGAPYETEFFHCLGCSLMFLEPELFAAANEYRETSPQHIEGAPGVALRSDAIRSRFWAARAKRENGGLQANSEAILRVRDRYRQ